MNEHDDSAWQALLRANSTPPPSDDVDWTAFHARITAGAAPLLRRRTTTWWLLLGSRTTRVARGAAVAAAFAIVILSTIVMPERPAVYGGATEFRTIEEELTGTLPYASVPLLADGADRTEVLDALLFYDGEEW